MVQIKANQAVTSFLVPLKERVQILDDRGMILGYFEPESVDENERYRRAASLFTAEEIQRSQKAEGRWSTTDEVLSRLQSMGDA